ncbi:unnamed protein product [Mucor hiemalis]
MNFSKDRRRSFGKNFITTSANQVKLDYIHWIASSWYPPANNNRQNSQIPASPPSPLSTTPNNIEVKYDLELVDQYGWTFLGDKYYNIETNVLEDRRPFANHDDN